ncbi:hypothetical protein RHSIM_Rhsim13G0032000 [Rhododendron simsii]|uniref:GTD-binding domain-containing protein n=1 Tax=Rhododendron simsii TaxID=118357 RepID=A0A834G0I1_RHOSS|nr:hypothetical protein RHSIM_Rhsim13G0032000 [Rhododendron simsii]
MAVKPMATVNLERKPRGFMDNLSSMAFEWLLIFLLFLDAALSYLLTKLARYCELQTPCLLCSRLDHVFGNEKPGFYRSLLCSNHRMEISSLVSCHVHGKLADARRMCEECLMSFAIRTKTTPESYRLLVGKLGVNLDHCGFQNSFLPKNIIPGSLSTWTCSCCSKTCRARTSTQRLLQLPVGFGTLKTSAKPPLPRLPGRGRLTRRDSFKKIKDKIPGSTLPRRLGNTGGNALSHVGYTELKINSDSESEYLFSDDDDRSSVIRENTSPTDSSGSLPKAHSEDLASVDQTHQGSDPGPSLLDQCIPLEVNDPRDVDCLGSDNYIGHGLGELNWEQANPKQYSSALPDFISLDDVSPSSNVINGGGISEDKSDGTLPHNSTLSMLSELVVPNFVPSSSNVMTIPNGVSPDMSVDAHGTKDIGHKSVIKHGEVSAFASTKTAECIKNDHALDDNAPSMSSNRSPSDKCKLSDTGKGREVYSMIDELYERSSSAKVHDQILSVSEIGWSPGNASPRWNGHHDELQRIDASCGDGIQVIQKTPFLGKIDSGYESFDGISVGEIEGESSFDRLKRQVEYDRSCLSSLCKELEEERNASEVAAHQAMAMITRLQEEKASLHMEALQYLRMMEEQAEYDMEALEKANDLLAEKEKEVQDLEAELEFYRANYPDETKVESLPLETSNSKLDKDKNIKSLLLGFEGEKLYISQCLKELERKLYPIKSLSSRATQKDHQKEENGFLTPNDLSASRVPTAEGSDISIEENSDVIKENNHFDFNRSGGIDLIAVENEISELDGRLQALEADRNLLEHALSSLRNGNDGLQFIKEIAHQLQELRKIRIEKRCPSVS